MNKSGIYRIRNLVTGDLYIGSTINFRERWNCHRADLRNKVHANRHLIGAWHKYSEVNFVFEIIELCQIEVLHEREQVYLDVANNTPAIRTYNLSKIAAHGGLSKEGRQRKRDAMKGNTHTLGRIRPADERARISAGNRGKKRSPEAIENYRRAAQKREAENRRIAQAIPVTKPWETS